MENQITYQLDAESRHEEKNSNSRKLISNKVLAYLLEI